MSNGPRPVFVAHADWSSDSKKRWMATGSLAGASYHLSSPEPVGDVTSLLYRLNQRAGGGPVVAGFDFPIGLPYSFAEGAQIARFVDILPLLGSGNWANFYNIAASPTEISFSRPFYPYRPGGSSQAHLTSALGVPNMRAGSDGTFVQNVY